MAEMFREGASDEQIGAALGVGAGTIRVDRRHLGLKRKPGRPPRSTGPIDHGKLERYRHLRSLGHSYGDIAQLEGVTRQAVQEYLKRWEDRGDF